MVDLQKLLDAQRDLQVIAYGRDPTKLNDEERAEYIRWNVLALISELNEMLDECGWKPWASSRHLNRDAYIAEGVDALHFFLNLMLAARATGNEITTGYYAKRNKNAARQVNGYSGKDKCPSCRRALDDEHVLCTPSVCAMVS